MEQTVLDKPEWNKTDQELEHNKDPHRDNRIIIGNKKLYRTKWKYWVGNMYQLNKTNGLDKHKNGYTAER